MYQIFTADDRRVGKRHDTMESAESAPVVEYQVVRTEDGWPRTQERSVWPVVDPWYTRYN